MSSRNAKSSLGGELLSKSVHHIKRIKMDRDLFASPFVSEPSSESNKEKQIDWTPMPDLLLPSMDDLPPTEFDDLTSLMSPHDSMSIPASSPLYHLPMLSSDAGFSISAFPRCDIGLDRAKGSDPFDVLIQFVRDTKSKARTAGTKSGNHRESRNNFTPKQRETLNKWLVEHSSMPYPSQKEIQSLSTLTGLTIRQIRVYLTNGRIRLLQRRKRNKTEL